MLRYYIYLFDYATCRMLRTTEVEDYAIAHGLFALGAERVRFGQRLTLEREDGVILRSVDRKLGYLVTE